MAAAFSPHGTQVVTASTDNTARVWDTQVGTSDDGGGLADLVEVFGRVRLSPTGALESLSNVNARLATLR